jgi:hypothetical protein
LFSSSPLVEFAADQTFWCFQFLFHHIPRYSVKFFQTIHSVALSSLKKDENFADLPDPPSNLLRCQTTAERQLSPLCLQLSLSLDEREYWHHCCLQLFWILPDQSQPRQWQVMLQFFLSDLPQLHVRCLHLSTLFWNLGGDVALCGSRIVKVLRYFGWWWQVSFLEG